MRMLSFIVFSAVLTIPVVAAAHPCPAVDVNLNMAEQAQTWWMVLLDFLLQLVAPLSIAVLTTLASVAVRRWGRKLDQDKQEALIRLTDGLVVSGVAFAEEQGRKALKAGGVKTEGAQKMSMATEFVSRQLAASGLPDIARDELTQLIESRLAQERAKPDGAVPSDQK